MSPQVTVLFGVAGPTIHDYGRPAVLGLFRVVERAGLLAGPLVAGLLLETHSFATVVAALSGLAAVSCAAFLGAFLVLPEHKTPPSPLRESP